jgi:hypothetical protein
LFFFLFRFFFFFSGYCGCSLGIEIGGDFVSEGVFYAHLGQAHFPDDF